MILQIPITRFDDLPELIPVPVYVIVCGGIAVGKSHVVQKYLTKYVVADIDDYMTRNGFRDYTRDGAEFSQCMTEINEDIQQYKRDRKFMVAMGTGANYKFLHFRLNEARQNHYRTAILHVTCPSLEQAHAQNAERLAKQEHGVAPDQLDVIQKTIDESADSVRRVRDEFPYLVDFFCPYENLRVQAGPETAS